VGDEVSVRSPGSTESSDPLKERLSPITLNPIFGLFTYIAFPLAALISYLRFVLPSVIEQNEQAAVQALKSIATAEADFRTNDRDGNHVYDFWTGDVSGLYSLPASSRPIALIDREIALADAAALQPLSPRPASFHGYYFLALEMNRESDPPTSYKEATDSSMGKVHHPSQFGFCAFPEEYGRTGRTTFIINEGNTIFRFDLAGKPLHDWPSIEAFGISKDAFSRIED
jgi:hypothetical protein